MATALAPAKGPGPAAGQPARPQKGDPAAPATPASQVAAVATTTQGAQVFSVAGQITKRLLKQLGRTDPAWSPPRNLRPKAKSKPGDSWAPTGRKPRKS